MRVTGGGEGMKEIELRPAMEYAHKLDVDVIDFPDGEKTKARKRCGITLDYGWRDVAELQRQELDMEGMLACYRQRIYDLVKVNISQDWTCTGGMDETLAIVEKHIRENAR